MDSGFGAVCNAAQLALRYDNRRKNESYELTTEIKELNLTYLMLAQQMVRTDKDMAIFRLGISKDIAEILEVLTPARYSSCPTPI